MLEEKPIAKRSFRRPRIRREDIVRKDGEALKEGLIGRQVSVTENWRQCCMTGCL